MDLLRLAAGTRVEGTVQPPPPPQAQPSPAQTQAQPQADAARAAVQTLQNAADTARQDVRTDTARADTRADTARLDAARAATTPAPTGTPSSPRQPAAPQPQVPVVHVRTPVGDVTLRTPLPLPEGARVAFDIATTNNNQVTVRLTSLNGQPIQQALVQLAADRAAAPPQAGLPPTPTLGQPAPTAALTFGQAWTPNGPVALTQAGSLNAFVLTGTAAPGAAAAANPQTPLLQNTLLTGSDLTVRVTGVTPGQPGGQPGAPALNTLTQSPGTVQTPNAATPSPGIGGTPTPGTGAATPGVGTPASPATGTPGAQQGAPTPATTQITPQGPGSTLPTGGTAQSGLRLVGAQGWPPPPFATPTQGQAPTVQLALTGTVTGQSTTAQPTIQTTAGTVQLASPANLPPGTTVTLDVLAQSAARTTGAAANAPPPSPGTLPFTAGTAPWPAMTEALQVLQRSDPQAAQLLANTVPDGGPRTIVATMSFIQSMRSGDMRQWPGDNNLRALERTGPRGAHLARTISGEVAQLSAQTRETAGEWRTTPVPWNANGQIEKISLITRREESDDDEDESDQNTSGSGLRFLLDLDLTQLGPLQLDGMVHEEKKGFDMIIRSHEPLDEAIRRDLMGLFVATNQAVGLKGGLTFQVTPKFADPIKSNEPFNQKRDGVWA